MLQRIHRRYRRRFSSQSKDRPSIRVVGSEDNALLRANASTTSASAIPHEPASRSVPGDYLPEPDTTNASSFLFPPMDAYMGNLPMSMPVPHVEMEEVVTVGSISDLSINSLASVAAHIHEGPPQFTRAEMALDRGGAFGLCSVLVGFNQGLIL